MKMNIPYNKREVSLSDIDLNDNTYKITKSYNISKLKDSILDIGLIAIPFLLRKKEKFIIISGFHRIRALSEINAIKTWAKVIIPEETDTTDLAKLAIAENGFIKELNLIEKASALSLLKKCYDNEEIFLKNASPLNLPNNKDIIEKLLKINEMPNIVKNGISNETIALSGALMLLNFPLKEMIFLAELLNEINVSLNNQRNIITLLKEISAKYYISISEIFEDKILASILDEKDKKLKANILIKRLNSMRYPTITEALEKFYDFTKKLNLNKKLSLKPPVNFEGQDYEINIKFKNAKEIDAHIKDIDIVKKALFI